MTVTLVTTHYCLQSFITPQEEVKKKNKQGNQEVAHFCLWPPYKVVETGSTGGAGKCTEIGGSPRTIAGTDGIASEEPVGAGALEQEGPKQQWPWLPQGQ